jgi:hypothetical protein
MASFCCVKVRIFCGVPGEFVPGLQCEWAFWSIRRRVNVEACFPVTSAPIRCGRAVMMGVMVVKVKGE